MELAQIERQRAGRRRLIDLVPLPLGDHERDKEARGGRIDISDKVRLVILREEIPGFVNVLEAFGVVPFDRSVRYGNENDAGVHMPTGTGALLHGVILEHEYRRTAGFIAHGDVFLEFGRRKIELHGIGRVGIDHQGVIDRGRAAAWARLRGLGHQDRERPRECNRKLACTASPERLHLGYPFTHIAIVAMPGQEHLAHQGIGFNLIDGEPALLLGQPLADFAREILRGRIQIRDIPQ